MEQNLDSVVNGGKVVPLPKTDRSTPQAENSDQLIKECSLPRLSPDALKQATEPHKGFGATFIESVKKSEISTYAQIEREMSFDQFLDRSFARPDLFFRNTAQYTVDCMESFGTDDVEMLGRKIVDFVGFRNWKWQSESVDQKMELVGQELPTFEYYNLCKQFARQAHPDQMVIFHGQPGGGKTRLAETIESALEHFSKYNPDGALYKLVFTFDSEKDFKKKTGNFGYGSAFKAETEESSGGYRVPASLHTNPIFLFSNERTEDGEPSPREKFFYALRDQGRIDDDFNANYLLQGRLDSTSQGIYDALLKHYNGDLAELIKNHVKVERYTLSSQVGRGLVSIRPNPDRQSDVEPLYPSHPLMGKEAPEILENAEKEIHLVQGLIPNANRGHVHFCDLLRENERDRSPTDLSRLDYLLETIEGGKLQINSHRDPSLYREENLDVLFTADTNDTHIMQKRQGAGWEAFKQRCEFVVVPYMRRFLSEADVHRSRMAKLLTNGREAAPHVLETLALFATASRLLIPNPSYYAKMHEDLPEIIKGMNVVEKALLLQGAGRNNPDRDLNIFRPEDKKLTAEKINLIKRYLAQIADEHMQGVGETRFMLYDGGMGVSTRETGKLLKAMMKFKPNESFTVLEVVEVLERRLKGGFKFDQEVSATKENLRAELMDDIARQEGEPNYRTKEYALRRITDKANEKVNELYPVPGAKEIVDQIKVYAKAKIQNDILTSLGLVNEVSSIFTLKRYLNHVVSHVNRGNFAVRKEYRLSSLSDAKADDNLMKEFESNILKRSFYYDGERDKFRSGLVSNIATWQLNNEGKAFDDCVEEIFLDMVGDIRKAQKEAQQKVLNEFLTDTEKYLDSPEALRRDKADAGNKQRAEAWEANVEKLESLGYPRDSLGKHIYWVFGKAK